MSDSLRDALEKLAAKWADQPTDYDEDTEQQIEDGRALRDLLTAHPVEPAGVSDEAVEAGVRAALERNYGGMAADDTTQTLMRDDIRAALEAVQPFMQRDLLAAPPGAPDVSARVIREHEPRHMGCACGAPMGDSIDYRWHLVNQTIAAVRSS